mmetsp:Transcript_61984/g.69406  ORF Transcript_61984/g.69406 Transcript_61984/m.69406 type:complete len:307 (-) Transcript_61984:930-1850(-)
MVRNSSNTVVSAGGASGGSTIVSSTLSSLGTSKSSKLATSSSVNGSPSFARRRALKEADDTANQLRVLDCYPLSKYMAIADKLFGYFEEAFDSLRLDDAYVYGMRFAELAITNLPTHQDWRATSSATTAGSAEDKLQSQIVKVVSRLEIIKRRMDEEESRKLRTGMLAQAEARAEEEVRRQNQFNRERNQQEQLNTLIPAVIGGDNNVCHPYSIQQHIDTTTSTIASHPEEDHFSEDDGVRSTEMKEKKKLVAAGGKSPKSKLRQFLNIPKEVGLLSRWSQQPQEVVSQPIVPSPEAITQSRAQHW